MEDQRKNTPSVPKTNRAPMIVFVMLIIGVGILFLLGKPSPSKTVSEVSAGSNVTTENGVQVIEIRAKGGYAPRVSTAKAGLPTILRFETAGTFDCSSSVRIPSLRVSQVLPANGKTDISLGSQPAGTLQGNCGMGMYPFEIHFEG